MYRRRSRIIPSRKPAYVQGALLLGLVGAVVLRPALWWTHNLPFHADEAIVALMARHILQGARPLFFYGQAYMGAMDAYLTALAFLFFGETVTVLRLVQGLLFAGSMYFSLRWLREHFGFQAVLWGLPVWISVPVGFLLYTSFSLGGYGESLLAGSLLLWWTDHLRHKPIWRFWDGLFWGLVAGWGFWCNPLTGVYTLALGLWALPEGLRRAAWQRGLLALGVLVGLVMGLAPYGLYLARSGGSSAMHDLAGQRVPLAPFLRSPAFRLAFLLWAWATVTLGMRAPWEARLLGGPFAVIPLILLGLAWHPGVRKQTWWKPLAWIALVNFVAWWATPFAGDPSGRYALPSMHAWVSFVAGALASDRNRLRRLALLTGFLFHALWGWTASMWGNAHLTPQFNPASRLSLEALPDLQAFLEGQALNYGYTNYWIAYPLAFFAQERLIYAPRLPYHPDLRYTPLDDRILAYTCQVRQQPRLAYITSGPPALDAFLRLAFRLRGLTWKEAAIANFHVYYDLSRPVHPWDMGLSPPPPSCTSALPKP